MLCETGYSPGWSYPSQTKNRSWYNIFYNIKSSLPSNAIINKKFYCIFFLTGKKNSINFLPWHIPCSQQLQGAGFFMDQNNFRGSAGAVFTVWTNRVSPCSLGWDTVSSVLEEVCQSHRQGAPGYITSVSLTSPLRSYFSNVQSSLWLLCSSLPSSSHRHSTSKVVRQKHSAISPTKSFQKLQVCSPHLSRGLGNWKQPCHTKPCLLSCFHLSSLDQTT